MNRALRSSTSLLAVAFTLPLFAACASGPPDYSRALPEGSAPLIPLEPGEPIPDFGRDWEHREDILPALEESIAWTSREHARQFFPQAGISHDRALQSLERFRELMGIAISPEEFQRMIEAEFQVYKAAGWDGQGGGVLFTAYCTPLLNGSLEPLPGYEYPLYGLPPDLVKGPGGVILGRDLGDGNLVDYPSRGAIEAGNLLANQGLELVWLSDPIDAYIAHVNGSAFIQLRDGTLYRLGYAGKNGRAYHSLGKALAEDGLLPEDGVNLAGIRQWAASATDEEIHSYLSLNQSYVFFTPIFGNPHGSLDVPVTSGRSVATDKTLFPRGAIVWVDASESEAVATDAPMGRFYFDQDTGGAIRTAGRADLYLGIGPEAEAIAGATKIEGQMYYLFLKGL